jgi:hypothetical protein
MSQACQTKDRLFEAQSGHFFVSIYCFYSMPPFQGKVQHPEPDMILLYVPWWHRVMNLVPKLKGIQIIHP